MYRLLLTSLLIIVAVQPEGKRTFLNPILAKSAGDPTVLLHKGSYYLAATGIDRNGWSLLKSSTLTDFNGATKIRIWEEPATPSTATDVKDFVPTQELWAPELLHHGGRFYFYFTALGPQGYHRHYVLDADKIEGPYTFRGDVDPEHDAYALDGSVLEHGGKLYWLYAGDHAERGLNIAPMESPLRVAKDARRTNFATGTQPWESAYVRKDNQWVKGNFPWIEAPQPLYHAGRVFVFYSAGHTATPDYAVGLLELTPPTADPMVKGNWRKSNEPVLAPTKETVTVGHNSFTTSKDGQVPYILYHAREVDPSDPWDRKSHRTLRAQPFTFTKDGSPQLSPPPSTTQPVPSP